MCSHSLFLLHATDFLLVKQRYSTFHDPCDTTSQLRSLPASWIVTPLSLWAKQVRELVLPQTNSVISFSDSTSLTGLKVKIKRLIMQN